MLYKLHLIFTKSKFTLHLRLACRMNVENETPQEGRGTSHSEEAYAERAASANVLSKIAFKLYISLINTTNI